MPQPFGDIHKDVDLETIIDQRIAVSGGGGGGSPLAAWPVGSVYFAFDNTDPATKFGGTWQAIGAGYVLIGVDPSDPDIDAAGKTAGSKAVAAAGVVSQPTFAGAALAGGTRKGGTSNPGSIIENGAVPSGTVSQPAFTGSPTSVVQPSLAVYMWRRTA